MAVEASSLASKAVNNNTPSQPSVSKAQWTVIGLAIVILFLDAVIQPDIKNMLVNFRNKFSVPKTQNNNQKK